MRYNRKTQSLQMEELGISKTKSKRSFKSPNPNYTFQTYSRHQCKREDPSKKIMERASSLCCLFRCQTRDPDQDCQAFQKEEMFKLSQVPDHCLPTSPTRDIQPKFPSEKGRPESPLSLNGHILLKETSV